MTWILLAFMELASTVSPEAVLQSVRERHQLSEDISYTFSQTYVDELRGARAPETGTILVKKDGRFRWAYQAPERKDFIFDGTRAWLYEPSKSQATEFEGFATSAASQALQFLWGQGQLDALFNLDWCSEECPKGEGHKLLELRPKSHWLLLNAWLYRSMPARIRSWVLLLTTQWAIKPSTRFQSRRSEKYIKRVGLSFRFPMVST